MKISHIRDEDDGIRLDRWIGRYFPEVTQAQIQQALRKKAIRVDGKRAEGAGQRLSAGQEVKHPEFAIAIDRVETVSDYDRDWLRKEVLYKDANLLAINKPAGLATQGGTGQKKHIDGLLSALKFELPDRPKLVHRLDKDTSGVLLLARNAKAADLLMNKFRDKETRKYYWALVAKVPNPPQGEIKLPLAKQNVGGGQERMVVDDKDGKRAHTEYRVIERLGQQVAWVECSPLTGRTHQLRVHLAEIGHPILNDYKYGGEAAFPEGMQVGAQLHLHARQVVLPEFYGKTIEITAPIPPHMKESFDLFGLKVPRA